MSPLSASLCFLLLLALAARASVAPRQKRPPEGPLDDDVKMERVRPSRLSPPPRRRRQATTLLNAANGYGFVDGDGGQQPGSGSNARRPAASPSAARPTAGAGVVGTIVGQAQAFGGGIFGPGAGARGQSKNPPATTSNPLQSLGNVFTGGKAPSSGGGGGGGGLFGGLFGSRTDPSVFYPEYTAYDQGGYAKSAYEQGGGYPQSAYDQAAYDPYAYAQPGYNQGGYTQAAYNQGGYTQAAYNQGGYTQAAYNQGGYDPNAYHPYYRK